MNGYEYKDQPFSVEIAEALIPERWSTGNLIKNVEKRVLCSHTSRGGLEPPEGENSRLMVSEALRNLSSVAKASEISKDVWRYGQTDQWVFGSGKHWVYLYYFPDDKQNAEPKAGRTSLWQCRIGTTEGIDTHGKIKYDAPEKRVGNQTRSYRQKPITALLIRADRNRALEKAIQGILTVREQDITEAKGNSWFSTNPCEVVEIVAHIRYDLLSPVNNVSAALLGMERKILR